MGVASLHGKRLGIDNKSNQLVSNGKNISQPCVDATITVSAEGASQSNQRDITIQLLDSEGNDINYQEIVELFIVGAANLNAASAGGSTGIAAGTDGAILSTVTAKTHFILASESDGDIDLIYTDTGTAAAFMALRLPSGRVIFSDALTNA